MVGAAVLWLVGVVGLAAAGQRVNIDVIHAGWQFAEYRYLAAAPLEAAWLFHVQPPLWNLILGITIWLPGSDAVGMSALLGLIGAGCAALAARLVVVTVGGWRRAAIVGAAAGLWPTMLPALFSPMYELPTSLLLLALLNVVVVGVRSLSSRRLTAVAVLLTAASLIRATVHPLLVIVVLVWLVWLNRSRLRRWHRVLTVGVPALVFAVLILKNLILVGVPSLTSWQGMNLLHSTQPVVPQQVLDDLAAAGTISDVGRVPAFSPYAAYVRHDGTDCSSAPGLLGAPTFDDPLGRPPWGEVPFVTNFNSRCFVPLYADAGRDGLVLIRSRPGDWWTARVVSLRSWFTTYPSFGSPVERIRDVFDQVDVGLFRPDVSTWSNPQLALVVHQPLSGLAVLPFVTILTGSILCLRRRSRNHQTSASDRLVVAATIVYVSFMLPSIVFEFGEQARFRSVVEQVAVTSMLVVALQAWDQRRADRSEQR